jgi:hypothetical protein
MCQECIKHNRPYEAGLYLLPSSVPLDQVHTALKVVRVWELQAAPHRKHVIR